MDRCTIFLAIATGLAAPHIWAQAPRDAKPVSGPCVHHVQDEHDYLLQVCEHIVQKKLPVTTHPNTWTVTRIEERELEGKPTALVYLSCCYIGDVAFFDKASGKLVKYALGPK